MDKLRFEFTMLPASDGKSNMLCITSITTTDDKVYILPTEMQPALLHTELIKTPAFAKVKNSLKKRHQMRKVWITLTKELQAVYMDEDHNLQYADQYLEEIKQESLTTLHQTETGTLEKLLEKILVHTQTNKQQNLNNIVEKFAIEKFTSKNTNANQWIDTFEKECIRFDVTSDEKKIEILRFFMDKSCVDWYSSMIIKLTISSDWLIWRSKFCESFANKGWNPVTYALIFKYKDGSLLDYAMRKEKLLLDMRRTIDTGTMIDLIAGGLPEYVINKIDREGLKDTVDLFNEVSKYEHMVNKKTYFAKRRFGNLGTNSKNENLHPCTTCEKLNKGTRYHPETACWFKSREEDKIKRNNIKHVNNSVIEAKLNETDQKNE